jgi:archaellum biogenesis ATPase FlaH
VQPDALKIITAQEVPLGVLPVKGKDSFSPSTPKIEGLDESNFLDQEGPDSIRPGPPLYKDETAFSVLTAADILAHEDEAVGWVLDDYLPSGGLVILAGKPKEGKSTLTYELAMKVVKGQPFIGRSTSGGSVLILALEEHPRDVRMRLQALGLQESDKIFVRVESVNPTRATLAALCKFVVENGIKLVVIDTLSALWRVADENDASAVTAAIQPLLVLARESGACVLLIHHARKSEGSYGDEIRGSGALFATVDVALILKRHEIATQRKLIGISRYADTPAELILELRDSGYVALGDPADLNKQARLERVRAALGHEPELPAAIFQRADVKRGDGYRLLNILVDQGEVIRSGSGRKGDPFLYKAVSDSSGSPSPWTNNKVTEEVIVDAD